MDRTLVRAALERGVRGWWAGGGGAAGRALAGAALPAELLFRAAAAARGAAYDAGLLAAREAPVPVLSVGNLTVGGTGKTPMVGWTVRVLADAGHRPAVVARGHGRDELLLHRRWNPAAAVHADADRVRGARAAAAAGADVLVLDDGFQHRRLARTLDVVLLAAEQPFPGRLLPRGPYRELAGALGRAHLVVVTRRVATAEAARTLADTARRFAPAATVARARLAAERWEDLRGRPARRPEGATLAVAGVAGPGAFAAMVAEQAGGAVELMAFPDHHEYAPADLERVRRTAAGRTVAVTEKDAVKLREHAGALPDVRVLALAVEIEAGETQLRDAILAAARDSGRSQAG